MNVRLTGFWLVLLLSVSNYSLAVTQVGTENDLNLPNLADQSTGVDNKQKYRLGWDALTGKTGNPNYRLAFQYLSKAAASGHLQAQANLGAMYELGLGIAKDYKAAYKWYRESAIGGLPDAQYNLANLYYHGLGVSSSTKKAVYWFHKAAEQQHATSELMLAAAYFLGRGIERSTDNALYWARRSSGHHLAEASYALGLAYKHGIGVAENSDSAAENFYQAGIAFLKRENSIKVREMLKLIKDTSPKHKLYFELKSEAQSHTSKKVTIQRERLLNSN